MRTALRGSSARVKIPRPTFEIAVLPPPVGGWNVRDSLPLMEAQDAIILDNWIPDTTSMHLRSGFSTWATLATTATAVETLMQYAPPNTSNAKLFAATADKIWDVTLTGTASSTAQLVTGLTNGRWQHDHMVNVAGSFLVCVNGADQPRKFDGSTFATCSVSASGLTRTNLISVKNHMNRLWFLEENQPWAWYLGTSAVEGVLTQFLPPFRKGGKCMAIGSWTRDGGSGPDDYLVFVSSRGECIIYAGTDPSSASTMALVGVFNIPDVIGRRCLIPAGAELCILTMQGLVPLSQILGMSPGAAARSSFTDKISGKFKTQFFTTGSLFGWQAIEYPRGNLVIVNVPIAERVSQHQYVMNEITGSWCRFTGINSGCWSLLGTNIYFGGDDAKVYKFDSGTLDGSANIVGTIQHAYNTFNSKQTKRFTLGRPTFNAPTAYNPPITILTDYDTQVPSTTVLAASTAGTQWDTAQWDTFQWAGGSITTFGWQSVAAEGTAGSVAFSVSSSETLIYNGTDVGYEAGGVL